jgi:hypothetical protein
MYDFKINSIAKDIYEALELSKGSPMNEIGKTEIMIWDVYYVTL